MADLGKVRRNIARMLAQGAQEAEIDMYVSAEGTTAEELREFAVGGGQGIERPHIGEAAPVVTQADADQSRPVPAPAPRARTWRDTARAVVPAVSQAMRMVPATSGFMAAGDLTEAANAAPADMPIPVLPPDQIPQGLDRYGQRYRNAAIPGGNRLAAAAGATIDMVRGEDGSWGDRYTNRLTDEFARSQAVDRDAGFFDHAATAGGWLTGGAVFRNLPGMGRVPGPTVTRGPAGPTGIVTPPPVRPGPIPSANAQLAADAADLARVGAGYGMVQSWADSPSQTVFGRLSDASLGLVGGGVIGAALPGGVNALTAAGRQIGQAGRAAFGAGDRAANRAVATEMADAGFSRVPGVVIADGPIAAGVSDGVAGSLVGGPLRRDVAPIVEEGRRIVRTNLARPLEGRAISDAAQETQRVIGDNVTGYSLDSRAIARRSSEDLERFTGPYDPNAGFRPPRPAVSPVPPDYPLPLPARRVDLDEVNVPRVVPRPITPDEVAANASAPYTSAEIAQLRRARDRAKLEADREAEMAREFDAYLLRLAGGDAEKARRLRANIDGYTDPRLLDRAPPRVVTEPPTLEQKDELWRLLQRGRQSVHGNPDPLLIAATEARRRGALRTREEFDEFVNQFAGQSRSFETDPRELIERFVAAAPRGVPPPAVSAQPLMEPPAGWDKFERLTNVRRSRALADQEYARISKQIENARAPRYAAEQQAAFERLTRDEQARAAQETLNRRRSEQARRQQIADEEVRQANARRRGEAETAAEAETRRQQAESDAAWLQQPTGFRFGRSRESYPTEYAAAEELVARNTPPFRRNPLGGGGPTGAQAPTATESFLDDIARELRGQGLVRSYRDGDVIASGRTAGSGELSQELSEQLQRVFGRDVTERLTGLAAYRTGNADAPIDMQGIRDLITTVRKVREQASRPQMPGMPLPPDAAALKRLEGALNEDLYRFVREAGPRGDVPAQALADIRREYARFMDQVRRPLGPFFQEKGGIPRDPIEAMNWLADAARDGNMSVIGPFMRVLRQKGEAGDASRAAAMLVGHMAGGPGQSITLTSYLGAMRELSPEVRREIFSGPAGVALRRDLERLERVLPRLARFERSFGQGMLPLEAAQRVAANAGNLGVGLVYLASNLPLALTMAGGGNVLARFLASPTYRNWLLKADKMRGPSALAGHLRRLSIIANNDQDIGEIVTGAASQLIGNLTPAARAGASQAMRVPGASASGDPEDWTERQGRRVGKGDDPYMVHEPDESRVPDIERTFESLEPDNVEPPSRMPRFGRAPGARIERPASR